jgi:hypothetical protein
LVVSEEKVAARKTEPRNRTYQAKTMKTSTLHNLPRTQANACETHTMRRQGCSVAGYAGGALVSNLPWSFEILVEGAAFARGSKDPIQEALL